MTQVFITSPISGLPTWPDPGDFNPTNTVECVGMGGAGVQYYSPSAGWPGGGGGGGAYAIGTNVPVTFPVPYILTANPAYTIFGSHTYTPPPSTPGTVWAQGGATSLGSGMPGGDAGTLYYPSGNAGGKGGSTQPGGTNGGTSGGGGAGGPHGPGTAAVNNTSPSTPTAGGAADGGTVAGGAAGSAGQSGTQFDATHGIGSGGGGGTAVLTGPAAGSYGGGGGGGFGAAAGGAGGGPLIVITYTPFVVPPGINAGTFVY